jgi:hypothetical protein
MIFVMEKGDSRNVIRLMGNVIQEVKDIVTTVP